MNDRTPDGASRASRLGLWLGLVGIAVLGAGAGIGLQGKLEARSSAASAARSAISEVRAEKGRPNPPEAPVAGGPVDGERIAQTAVAARAKAAPAAGPASAPAAVVVTAAGAAKVTASGEITMEQYLDRLMMAESGGRDDAANPRSTAVGPYQFIERTWLDVMRRHFPDEAATLSPVQLLALRTDRKMARRAAEAYSRDNAAFLHAKGLAATYPHLRLAFLVGPQGAARILTAPADARVAAILGPAVAAANPFMYGLTAKGLVERSARDISAHVAATDGVAPGVRVLRPTRPRIAIHCNQALPSCRRWVALAEHKAGARRVTRAVSKQR